VLSGQALGVVVLLLLVGLIRPSFAGAGGTVALSLAGAGLLGLVGYLTFYRALEYGGAVGLVSSISATYGGVTTVLAVTVLGEHLGVVGAVGVALAVAGVALAAARPGRYSSRAGWLPAALVAHGASVTVLLLALPLFARRAPRRGSASGVAWAAAAGLTDAVGLLAFSRGGQVGQVAVTAAVSSVYPVIPLVGGILLFGEHLTRRQLVGVAGIIVGLVLIGIG
jgi:drug/metabolite transporter (DMT)-like permease